jgi:hypothetical protein
MNVITEDMNKIIKEALEVRLKELFLKDLRISKLDIENYSISKKTIDFKELKIKYDKNKYIYLSPSIYTMIGFDKFVLEKDSMQVDLNLDMETHYLSTKILENEEKRKINKIFKEKIKNSIEEELKTLTGEDITAYEPKIINVSPKGREMTFKDLNLEDSEGNKYKVKAQLTLPKNECFNFHFMDKDKSRECKTTSIIEIKKEENLNNVLKTILDDKSKNKNKQPKIR